MGCGALLLFLIARYINLYGAPSPWAFQKDAVFTILSFLNITKYPPSFLFCLITLGIMFLIFSVGEKPKNKLMSTIVVYESVPFFYFLLHFYLIHLLLVAILFMQGFHWFGLDFASGIFGRSNRIPSGLPLWAVYLIWISIEIVLYNTCLWYGKYKATNINIGGSGIFSL